MLLLRSLSISTLFSRKNSFPEHTEYIEEKLGDGGKALMILMKDDLRVALVTGHIPVREIASAITKELIQEKLLVFNRALKLDLVSEHRVLLYFP